MHLVPRLAMLIKRFCLAFLFLVVAAGAGAATLADRSAFAQGLWWDSTRSGNGFDIFHVGDEVMVLWYTYDADGKATWYTAQGSLRSQPSAPLTLLRHRWSGGRKADATAVGTLRLDIKSPESIEVSWTVGATQGKWSIRPFIVSGIMNEVDHSGTWFNPANSGWGFSMIEQGDVLGAILYTYDAAGEPTWVAGFGRDRGGVELSRFAGTCPSCTYTAPSASGVGRLGFDFWQEWEITLRNGLTLPMAAGVNLDGTRVTQLSRPASLRLADRQLAAFADDATLKSYLDVGMTNVTMASGGGFSSPPAATTFSTTNLQEAGVDEADLVKSDGRYIYTYASAGGYRRPMLRIAEVGEDGTSLALRGQVALQNGSEMTLSSAGLFLHGDRLVSVSGTQVSSSGGFGWPISGNWTRGITNIEVMSRAVPEAPSTIWRVQVDGHLIASRRIGDRLYVVTRFVPSVPGFVYGANYAPYAEMNRQLLARTPLSALLPGARINDGTSSPVVAAASVYAPPQGERPAVADMIVVLAIDLATPRIAQSLGIIGAVEAVYASPANLYLATSRTIYRASTGILLPLEPNFVATDIHQVRLSSSAMSIAGTGSVEGFLGADPDKAAFRLGEHDSRLRAVTSSYLMWGASTKNRLTVLEPSTLSPGLLRTVSVLPNAQRPQALGKPNELLYGTRFADDRLYAVTFLKTDPLYVVDLSNPADPKIAGELALPGFSDYLHPLPNGLLFGFGKDARPAGVPGDGQFAWYQGLQLTLFDVRDANQPRELQRKVIGKRGSDSALLRHHHAFSSLVQADGTTSIAIPARVHDGTMPATSDSMPYPWVESGLLRFEIRGSTAADAQIVQLPSLVTHSISTTGDLPAWQDAAANGARSILFRNGAIYVVNGQFWRLPTGGGFGPFVPNGPL
jgi:hypothetical protein